jgi:hypothetical protein
MNAKQQQLVINKETGAVETTRRDRDDHEYQESLDESLAIDLPGAPDETYTSTTLITSQVRMLSEIQIETLSLRSIKARLDAL